MTLEKRKKLAAHIQRLLKVRRVSFPIANTEKGPLSLIYTKDAPDFEIVLDAVPLSMNDYDNRELKAMVEKYLFEEEITTKVYKDVVTHTFVLPEEPEKKKRGRPAKSK